MAAWQGDVMRSHRQAVLKRIADAVCHQKVVPVFQPIVHLRSRAIHGFEVLARWTDPELGQISPVEFIPAVQGRSLLPLLTFNLMRAACTAAREWSGDFFLGFNVPPTLLQDPQSMDLLVEAITDTGFPFARIRIEMTEVELVDDEAGADHTIRYLKSLGAKVVLDDFGTGFSSLVRLSRFDFDEIKIDGSFVSKIESDADSRKIVAAVIGLGHSLGVPVVAECVETPEQAESLLKLGCDYAQGWLTGKPMYAAEVPQALVAAAPVGAAGGAAGLSPYHRQHQLQSLYSNAPVGLGFIDLDKRSVAANEEFARMVGKPLEQVVDCRIEDLYTPDIAMGFGEAVDQLIASGGTGSAEFRFPGRPETFIIFGNRVVDEAGEPLGVSVVTIDITDRKRAEQALRKSEALYRSVVELSPSVLWAAGPDGRLDYISPLPDEPADWTMQQRLEAWFARIHADDLPKVQEEWRLHQDSARSFEIRFRVRWFDGEWRWMLSRAAAQEQDGRVVRWFGVFSDITREIRLEARLASLGVGTGE